MHLIVEVAADSRGAHARRFRFQIERMSEHSAFPEQMTVTPRFLVARVRRARAYPGRSTSRPRCPGDSRSFSRWRAGRAATADTAAGVRDLSSATAIPARIDDLKSASTDGSRRNKYNPGSSPATRCTIRAACTCGGVASAFQGGVFARTMSASSIAKNDSSPMCVSPSKSTALRRCRAIVANVGSRTGPRGGGSGAGR